MLAVKQLLMKSIVAASISSFLVFAWADLSVLGEEEIETRNCALMDPLPDPETHSDSQLCRTIMQCDAMNEICRYYRVIDKFGNVVDQYFECGTLPSNP